MSTGNQSDSDVTPSRKQADKPQSVAKKAPATSWQKAAPFAVLSLVTFLLGIGLLTVMIWKGEPSRTLGLLYYIVLLTLGAASAAFLFGVFRSYSQYTGKVIGGNLELGGPVVVFVLVVVGGFYASNLYPRGGQSADQNRQQGLSVVPAAPVVQSPPQTLRGRVQDTNGNPVPKVTLRIGARQIDVDTNGNFTYPFPDSNSSVSAETSAPKYELRKDKLLPRSNEPIIVLHKP